MAAWLVLLSRLAVATSQRRRDLVLENLALRHQPLVLHRTAKPPRLSGPDLALWVWLARWWQGWKTHLRIVRPDTVIRWHRAGFRLFWKWKSRPCRGGRRPVDGELVSLIRQMSRANPLWGAPRIHGELLKLGFALAQRTVAKYLVPRARRPSSQTWTTFLRNHLGRTVSVDFFTVPTVDFRLLYVFLVLSHQRRMVLHFNVVECPSAAWTAQQLREAFPFAVPPKYLLRDRVGVYGQEFQRRAGALGLKDLRIAPHSPRQAPYVERLIGSLRRECLDRIIALNPAHLCRVLEKYLDYYHRSRTHLGLDKDAPEPRAVQGADAGEIVAFPQVGGLHHHYERRAA